MSDLPYSDPSNPALPSPLFSDVSAVRADHMRANNAAIFADLIELNARNPELVALTSGSFKTAALANANTYNGRSFFTCTAGVSDTPFAGAWRITGAWNPTDSSGRFVAMLDASLETWQINYTGGAWGTWTKYADADGNPTDANAIHKATNSEISTIAEKTVPAADDMHIIEDAAASNAKKMVKNKNLLSWKELITLQNGGFWGDIVWKDADEIIIVPKWKSGAAWVGALMNDGSYLESTSAITVKYDTPANGGNIIDGITAKLNNEFFILWAYDAAGTLAFGLTWMPNFTLKTANPTSVVTPNQINSQDACFLVPVGAEIALFQDYDEWETPLAWQNAGAITYNPARGKPVVTTRDATTITLGASLDNTDFTVGTLVYQVSGFKPLQIADGAIAAEIGTRGYSDTGFRFRTDGSGNILQFNVVGKRVIYVPAANGYGIEALAKNVVGCQTYIPPDKVVLVTFVLPTLTEAGTFGCYNPDFWQANGFAICYHYNSGSWATFGGGVVCECSIKYRLYKLLMNTTAFAAYAQGYVI